MNLIPENAPLGYRLDVIFNDKINIYEAKEYSALWLVKGTKIYPNRGQKIIFKQSTVFDMNKLLEFIPENAPEYIVNDNQCLEALDQFNMCQLICVKTNEIFRLDMRQGFFKVGEQNEANN